MSKLNFIYATLHLNLKKYHNLSHNVHYISKFPNLHLKDTIVYIRKM